VIATHPDIAPNAKLTAPEGFVSLLEINQFLRVWNVASFKLA